MQLPKEFQGTDGRYYWHSENLSTDYRHVYGGDVYLIFRSAEDCHDETAIQIDSDIWDNVRKFAVQVKYQININLNGRKMRILTDEHGNMFESVHGYKDAAKLIKFLKAQFGLKRGDYNYSEITHKLWE